MKHLPTRPSRRTRLATGAAVLPLVLALAACGSDDDGEVTGPDPVEVPTDSQESGTDTPDSDTPEATFDSHTTALVAAGRTAEGAVPDSHVVSIDHDDGEWDVEVATADGTEHDVRVSSDGTSVLSGPDHDDTDEDDRRDNQDRLEAAELDHEAAVTALVAAVANARIEELSLNSDRGQVIWEAEIAGSEDHQVDAVTGKVARR